MSSGVMIFSSVSAREKEVFSELKQRLKAPTMSRMLRNLVEAEAGRQGWTDLVTILQDESVRRAEMNREKGKIGGLKSVAARRMKPARHTQGSGGR